MGLVVGRRWQNVLGWGTGGEVIWGWLIRCVLFFGVEDGAIEWIVMGNR